MIQTLKNLPAMLEIPVQSLGWEDPLEKGMATHPSILAWKIPWTEEPGRLQSMELQSLTRLSDLALSLSTILILMCLSMSSLACWSFRFLPLDIACSFLLSVFLLDLLSFSY